MVNQRRNWINKTRCITVVRRDTQKCCTKHNQTELKRVHTLTYIIISTGRIRKVPTQVIQINYKVIRDPYKGNTGYTYTSNTGHLTVIRDP